MIEFKPCRKCSKPGAGPAPGYYYEKVDGFDVVKECACHKSWRERKDNFYAFSRAGVLGSTTENDYLGTQSLYDLKCLTLKNLRINVYTCGDLMELKKRPCVCIWGENL